MRTGLFTITKFLVAYLLASCGSDDAQHVQPEQRIAHTGESYDGKSVIPDTPNEAFDDQQPASTPVTLMLISDLDDTIKQTDTTSSLKAIYNGLFTSKAFAGMAELYRRIVGSDFDTNPNSFAVVSGSPVFIGAKVRDFLDDHNFPPPNQVVLKDSLCDLDTLAYKTKEITSLVETANSPVVLIGDDTEKDPEVFTQIGETYPAAVAKVYIRGITARRDLPPSKGGPSIVRFGSAFDIAADLANEGMLTVDDAIAVGQEILTADDAEICPDYADCCALAQMNPISTAAPLGEIDEAIRVRLGEICEG